jgi:hypothetical protein
MVIIIASQLVIMPPDSATISNTVLALMLTKLAAFARSVVTTCNWILLLIAEPGTMGKLEEEPPAMFVPLSVLVLVLVHQHLLGRPLAGHRHRFDQYRRFRCTTNALTVHTQLLLLPLRLPLPLLHCHLRLSSLLRLQLPLRQHCHQLRLLLVLLRPLPL